MEILYIVRGELKIEVFNFGLRVLGVEDNLNYYYVVCMECF